MKVNKLEPPQSPLEEIRASYQPTDSPRFPLGEIRASYQPTDSLGDDFNIPMLVQEAGGRQLARLVSRRSQLEQEIEKLNVDIHKLEQLVAVASSL